LNIFEILLLLALALIVVGPERLPEVLQMVGKVMRELRLASNTIMRELTEVADEPRKTLRELDPFKLDDPMKSIEPAKPADGASVTPVNKPGDSSRQP
jgi:Sec-independent protein translocase protein TatA